MILLTITTPARTIRIASDAVEILDTDGTYLDYVAGLDDVTITLALSWLSESGAASVPISCVLPCDIALDEASGHSFSGSAAEIAYWDLDETGDFSARVVLISGVVTDPEYGEIQDPVSFSVAAPAAESVIEVPSATERVDVTTMPTGAPTLATADMGLAYPRVFGSPGRIGSDWVAGGQGVWARHNSLYGLRIVIAGQWLTGSDYVWLSGDLDLAGHRFQIWNTYDSRGQRVAIVAESTDWEPDADVADADSAGVMLWDSDGDGYYYGLGCDFRPDAGGPNPNLPALLYQPLTTDTSSAVFFSFRGPGDSDGLTGISPLAVDVCTAILATVGSRVDYGRWAAAAPMLTGYRFDCVIDEQTAGLAWLRQNIYPLLPMSVESGGAGSYPVVWRYDATIEDATARLSADIDPLISRAGAVKQATADIANAFTIQYAMDVRVGTYTETATRDATTCPYCAESQRRFGRIEKSITTAVVYDAATAAAILAWWSRAYTQPIRRVAYLVPRHYRLARGQLVTITDSLIHLVDVLAIVASVQIDGSGIDGVELMIVADPWAYTRAGSGVVVPHDYIDGQSATVTSTEIIDGGTSTVVSADLVDAGASG